MILSNKKLQLFQTIRLILIVKFKFFVKKEFN